MRTLSALLAMALSCPPALADQHSRFGNPAQALSPISGARAIYKSSGVVLATLLAPAVPGAVALAMFHRLIKVDPGMRYFPVSLRVGSLIFGLGLGLYGGGVIADIWMPEGFSDGSAADRYKSNAGLVTFMRLPAAEQAFVLAQDPTFAEFLAKYQDLIRPLLAQARP